MMPIIEPLLKKPVLVTKINNNDISLNSSIQCNLVLLLEYKDSGGSKELFVQLTDDNDPLLLFSSSVNELVYKQLQAAQGLLGEFSSFPGHFSNLINQCIAEENLKNPKFVLLLKLNDSVTNLNEYKERVQLEIVEMNVFKNLLHLSIPLEAASYQSKLVHLSGYINFLKVREGAIMDEKSYLQNQVRKISAEMKSLSQEIERKNVNYSQRESALLSQQKERLLQVQSTMDRKMTTYKQEVEHKMAKRSDDYVNKIKSQNKIIFELKQDAEILEKIKNELTEKNEKLGNHLSTKKMDIEAIQKSKYDIELNLDKRIKSGNELQSRIGELEEKILNFSSANQEMYEENCKLRKENDDLKMYLDQSEEQFRSKNGECEVMYEQFQESVKFIEKYRSDLKAERCKSQNQQESLIKSQRELESKTKTCLLLSDSVKCLERKLEESENKYEETSIVLQSSQKKIKEQEVTIKSNENVIGWLNKQVNETERTDSIIKKIPLAEAYLTTKRTTSPIIDASTPVSTAAYSNRKEAFALSAVMPSSDSPSSDSPGLEKGNNSPGLDPKYLQGSRSKGLLRTNFDTRSSFPKGKSELNKKDISKENKKCAINKKKTSNLKSSYFD